MITIANPIYDVVFKYLMEDERIARTILSALLKMDIVQVEMRPHEYVSDKRDSVSMLRIDFGARVHQEDGTERLILIELQKTWLETETLRFRQYLGVQYENPRNMSDDGRQALPMVAVYLLGHRVGHIEEPVLYVRHQSYNYDGLVVTKGLPDPFVESLTHDSVIVQIPLLHGQVNNRLERILSVFDQTYKDEDNRKVLNIDDSLYANDADMQVILHRLLKAATDAKLRQDMNIEDEFISAIEKRDTEILHRDFELAKQKVLLDEQKTQLDEQKTQLDEQKTQLDEQKTQLDEQKTQLDEQKTQLDEQKTQLDEQKTQLDEQKTQLDEQKTQLDEQKTQLALKDHLLRKSVHALRLSNMSTTAIAESLGIDIKEVDRLLN